MKNFYLLISLLFLMTACQNETDFHDLESIENDMQRAFEKRDDNFMANILNDSIPEAPKHIRNSLDDIYDLFEEKSPDRLEYNNGNETFTPNEFKIYYKADDEYYLIVASFFDRKSKEPYQLSDISLKNLSKKCNDYQENPYTPHGFDVLRIQYRFYGGTFENGKLRIRNNTGHDIDYVKFRLKLFNENTSRHTPFFNQTVVSEEPIYKGDLSNIEIEGLNGYFIDERNLDLNFKVELLKIGPKPESETCLTVEELQKL